MGYSPHRSKGRSGTGGAATGPGKGGAATGHGANKSGMVFIVMVREPVSQHLSWWRLEQGSMAFAKEGLGMGEAYHREGGGGGGGEEEEDRHTPPTTPPPPAADAAAAAGLRKPMRLLVPTHPLHSRRLLNCRAQRGWATCTRRQRRW